METRQDYLKFHPDVEDAATESIEADMDTSKPLYFWQIYSIWGKDPITDICTAFYDSIYAIDDNSEDASLKQEFERLEPKKHHIKAQISFWVDSMGGGKEYPGGTDRLIYHHEFKAERVMNAKGAKHWIRHMKIAIQQSYDPHFQKDPRILASVIAFLETKMKSYAEMHSWEFDPNDFILKDFLPSPTATLATE